MLLLHVCYVYYIENILYFLSTLEKYLQKYQTCVSEISTEGHHSCPVLVQ